MAKSENGETVQIENRSVNTLSNLFASMADKFVVESGPNNSKDKDGNVILGKIYRILVPRSFTKDGVTVDMVSNKKAYENWLANNWDGSRNGFKGLTLAQKIARAADPENNGFVPPEPSVQSPVELAVQTVIAKRNPNAAAFSDAQLSRDPDMQRAVATTLVDAGRTETYLPLVEQALTMFDPNSPNHWSMDRRQQGSGDDGEDSAKFTY